MVPFLDRLSYIGDLSLELQPATHPAESLEGKGRLMGVVLTADGVAEALVPLLVANVREQTGSYAAGFSLLVVLAALGALAVAFLPKPPPAETLAPGTIPAH